MIRTSSLSGDIWLSYHLHGVQQLPAPWRLPVQTLGPAPKPAPRPPGGRGPCSAGGHLTRAVSLPEQDLDEEEEEEEEESDGDNLHRYREDSSFILHGNFNWAVSHGVRRSGHSLENKSWDVLDSEGSSSQPGLGDSPPTRLEVRGSSTLFLDSSTVQDLNQISGFNFGPPMCAESVLVPHIESVSDSSCNSSEGILVNFCTIYDRSNSPATPQEASRSPAAPPPPPHHHGAVVLNLQPVLPRSPRDRLQPEAPSPPEEPQVAEEETVVPSAPCWSPQALDSNCNLYSLEPGSSLEPWSSLEPGSSSEPWSSLEWSDLTACLQGRLTRLAPPSPARAGPTPRARDRPLILPGDTDTRWTGRRRRRIRTSPEALSPAHPHRRVPARSHLPGPRPAQPGAPVPPDPLSRTSVKKLRAVMVKQNVVVNIPFILIGLGVLLAVVFVAVVCRQKGPEGATARLLEEEEQDKEQEEEEEERSAAEKSESEETLSNVHLIPDSTRPPAIRPPPDLHPPDLHPPTRPSTRPPQTSPTRRH
ncbi:hypothetical protein CRUP_032767 [Coryphaenoides rupestris]|nr:hypothetical protein CRUP_032767 [Coryphaenoides rupestris]